jgi:hypothetical protein
MRWIRDYSLCSLARFARRFRCLGRRLQSLSPLGLFHRLATRYEKLKETFCGFIHLALGFIHLKSLVNVNTA